MLELFERSMILAIESSCDETAAAVIDGTVIRSNICFSQIKRHRDYGGVMPELASRLHAECIDIVLCQALSDAAVTWSDIHAIAVTVGPGLEGSLLVGITAANTLAVLLGVPIIPVNHLHGHIFSVLGEHALSDNVLACIASGGHTQLVHVQPNLQFKTITNTMDDACGEAFDKVARMLTLPYPGGPEIEALSVAGSSTVPLPHPVKSNMAAFSFSGLKTAVLQSLDKGHAPADIAASFQQTVADILVHKIANGLASTHADQLVLCGGVFCNRVIRSRIVSACPHIEVLIPPPALCTDNAAMIGLAAQMYQTVQVPTQTIAQVNTRLGMSVPICN